MILGGLFGSKEPSARLQLGAYGKLPLSKEFLRIRCSDGAGHAFYQWVNAGFDWTVRQAGSARPSIGAWHWLFFAEGLREAVVATLRDSTDAGEERAFPFACFALVRRERLGATTAESLGRALGLFRDLDALLEELAACDGRGAFQETLGRAVIDLQADAPDLEGSPAGPLRGAAQELHGLARAALVLSTGAIPGERLPALRLPIVGGAAPGEQALALVRALERTPLLEGRSTPVSLAIPRAAGASAAWLVPRPPRPSDFAMLVSGGADAMYPDPGGEVARVEVESRTDFDARLAEELPDGVSLADVARFQLTRAAGR